MKTTVLDLVLTKRKALAAMGAEVDGDQGGDPSNNSTRSSTGKSTASGDSEKDKSLDSPAEDVVATGGGTEEAAGSRPGSSTKEAGEGGENDVEAVGDADEKEDEVEEEGGEEEENDEEDEEEGEGLTLLTD